MGGAAALDTAYRGAPRVPPLTIPAFMPNAPASHVAMRQRATGPVLTYSVACASSAAWMTTGGILATASNISWNRLSTFFLKAS